MDCIAPAPNVVRRTFTTMEMGRAMRRCLRVSRMEGRSSLLQVRSGIPHDRRAQVGVKLMLLCCNSPAATRAHLYRSTARPCHLCSRRTHTE